MMAGIATLILVIVSFVVMKMMIKKMVDTKAITGAKKMTGFTWAE